MHQNLSSIRTDGRYGRLLIHALVAVFALLVGGLLVAAIHAVDPVHGPAPELLLAPFRWHA